MTRLWFTAAALLVVLTGCAVTPPAAPGSSDTDAAPAAMSGQAAPAASSPAAPAASPAPEPTADTRLGVRRKEFPETPLPTLTAEQQARFGECLGTTVGHWAKGECSNLAQAELKQLGVLPGEPQSRIGVPAVNAILRYQRSRDLPSTGSIGERTWYALASGQPARSTALPPECTMPGVVLCVDQGAEKLRFVTDGEVIREFDVRLGGFTSEPKTGTWRNHPTANGLFRVYNKHRNPPSANYGQGAMPYAVMFDPNMYVHLSTDFAKRGHTRSSHGCVNIAHRADAQWIFENTPIDARVYLW